MHVLTADDIELSFGDRHVLQGCSIRVEPRDRLGIVGPNGCGKSTMLALMAGVGTPDGGVIRRHGRVALLEQDPDFQGETVGDVAHAALSWHSELRQNWQDALDEDRLELAAELQGQLDDAGWVMDHKVESILEQTGAPPEDRLLEGLSGGERRRLALAATLLAQPDVLFLDEPTNHLDGKTIAWLEKYLTGYRGAVVLVTHDRYMLESVAERIIEIEVGVAVEYDGSYADYLIARAERQSHQQRTEDRRLRILARESAWAARSPAARSTKQKARLKRLEGLQEKGTLALDKSFALDFSTGMKTSGTFIEVQGLDITLGGRNLIRNLDLAVRPGERLGIIGANGAGKSTLLRAITGELIPDAGKITKASRVKVGMLDQARTGLEPTDTVFDAAGGGNDQVLVGENWIHVAGFLNKMLFEREQYDTRVEDLSGGERARLLLARKMLEGNAVLLLDEPTNDLDLWTLRVLEEALIGYDGAAIIVTHDRAFLDRVCTNVLAFEGDGQITRYADRLQAERAIAPIHTSYTSPAPAPVTATPKAPASKLSWKENKELEGLPSAIEVAEQAVTELEAVLADPATYQDRNDEVAELNIELGKRTAAVEALYARWEDLTDRAG